MGWNDSARKKMKIAKLILLVVADSMTQTKWFPSSSSFWVREELFQQDKTSSLASSKGPNPLFDFEVMIPDLSHRRKPSLYSDVEIPKH